MAKALQRLGAVGLLFWTVLGLVAWGLAAKEVRIVFEETSGGSVRAEAGAEGLAQLHDRVETLSQDLRGLSEAVEVNFAGLMGRLEALEEQQASLRDKLAQPARVEPTAVPEVIAPVPPPESKATSSFLSFKLPSQDFQFSEERTFQILGSLSRVGFDGKSTIHDFTGVSDKPEGRFTVNLSDPGAGISGSVSVRAAGIVTGSDGRDSEMYEHLSVEQFERIAFQFDAFEPSQVDVDSETTMGRVRGRMTIRGQEREVVMTVKGQMDASRRLVIEGEMPLSMSDFGVIVPAKLGMISVEDEVRVWIYLLARPMPKDKGPGR